MSEGKVSMRDMFRQHHRLTENERIALWEECEYVLDTNVLLNIYRYESVTRNDLFRVLRTLSGRIWVPYQVASEFYMRRQGIILEQRGKYDELTKAIEKFSAGLRGGAFSKSAFLDIEQIEAILAPAIQNAMTHIDAKRVEHPDLIHNDEYLEELVNIIGTQIGNKCSSEELQLRFKNAQCRIDDKRPPGYMDSQKSVPERYGDVMIWFEIVERAKSTSKSIILITDDDKEDWWEKLQGEKLGPRPELREELRLEAGVDFYIYNPATVMEIIGQQYKLHVSESSVQDANEVSREIHERSRQLDGNRTIGMQWERIVNHKLPQDPASGTLSLYRVEMAVLDFLRRTEEGTIVENAYGYLKGDFVHIGSGKTTLIEIKFLPSLRNLHKRIVEAQHSFASCIRGGTDYRIFFVTDELDTATEMWEKISASDLHQPFQIDIGFFDSHLIYVPIGSFGGESPDLFSDQERNMSRELFHPSIE